MLRDALENKSVVNSTWHTDFPISSLFMEFNTHSHQHWDATRRNQVEHVWFFNKPLRSVQLIKSGFFFLNLVRITWYIPNVERSFSFLTNLNTQVTMQVCCKKLLPTPFSQRLPLHGQTQSLHGPTEYGSAFTSFYSTNYRPTSVSSVLRARER